MNFHLKVFDKFFQVEFISFTEERSMGGNEVCRTVIFSVDNDIYRYVYTANRAEGYSSVVRIKDNKQLYSTYKNIDGGSYLEEIGRRFSLHKRQLAQIS